MFIMLLSGCGEERGISREVNISKEEVVSDSAVCEDAAKSEIQGEESSINYANRNSTNLYLTAYKNENDTSGIEQRMLDGTLVKMLKPEKKGADMISVRYVDDSGLYYTRWERGGATGLWRAPIDKVDGCDRVQLEQEEKVLETEQGIFDEIYCVQNQYIYFNELVPGLVQDGKYRKYDRKENKWVEFDGSAPSQPQEGESVRWVGCCGNTMIINVTSEVRSDVCNGLYEQKADTDVFEKIEINDTNFDKETLEEMVFNEKQMYFSVSSDEFGTKICRFCPGENEGTIWISEEAIKKAMTQAGFEVEELSVADMCLSEKKLYMMLSNREYEDIVFSCGLTDEPVLQLEDKLYEGYGGNQKLCWFVGDRCLISPKYMEREYYECFDLDTGKKKKVTKKDAEYWWQYW